MTRPPLLLCQIMSVNPTDVSNIGLGDIFTMSVKLEGFIIYKTNRANTPTTDTVMKVDIKYVVRYCPLFFLSVPSGNNIINVNPVSFGQTRACTTSSHTNPPPQPPPHRLGTRSWDPFSIFNVIPPSVTTTTNTGSPQEYMYDVACGICLDKNNQNQPFQPVDCIYYHHAVTC